MKTQNGKILVENDDYMTMPKGSTISALSRGGIEGLIFSGGGHSIHNYVGDLDSGANIEVSIYDNIKLEIYRGRKDNPKIFITHDEWPCTVEVIDNSKNMDVIVRKENQ